MFVLIKTQPLLIFVMRSREISLKSNTWHFQFSIWLFIWLLIWSGTFCWKPHLNQSSGFKVMSDWKILKTIERKRNSLIFWLYLTINAPDFWLILLDHNTFVGKAVLQLQLEGGMQVWKQYSSFSYNLNEIQPYENYLPIGQNEHSVVYWTNRRGC